MPSIASSSSARTSAIPRTHSIPTRPRGSLTPGCSLSPRSDRIRSPKPDPEAAARRDHADRLAGLCRERHVREVDVLAVQLHAAFDVAAIAILPVAPAALAVQLLLRSEDAVDRLLAVFDGERVEPL